MNNTEIVENQEKTEDRINAENNHSSEKANMAEKMASIEHLAAMDTPAPKRRRRKRLIKKEHVKVVRFIAALMIALIFLAPIVFTIANSFMSSSEISSNYGAVFQKTGTGGKVYIGKTVNLKLIPDIVSFSQYITVLFKSPAYLLKFWNSIFLVIPIVIFQLTVATFSAYGFARYDGRIRGTIFFFYIILMLMPYQVTLVPNYLVSERLDLLNTYWAIWLPGIFSPFSVYLITKYMKRIPPSLIEAAQIDGAGEWMIFRKVCMPLCKGIIFSTGILVFIDYWNMVEQPLILLTDTDKYPLSVYLSKINSGEISLAFAVATIYMIPTLLVFLYGEEYLVEGITYQGGVKA